MVLESFISYCNDMKVGCESTTGIEKKWQRLQKDLENIKLELKNENDIDKIIRLLEREKTILNQAKNQISSESKIGFKDAFRLFKLLILPLVGTISTVACAKLAINEKMNKETKETKELFTLATGTITAVFAKSSKEEISKILKIKNRILKK